MIADLRPKTGRSTARTVQFRRHRDPGYYPLLYGGYLALALVVGVWRTAVVDWSVWFAPLAWLGDMFALLTTGLFFGIVRRSDSPVVPAVTSRSTIAAKTVDILIPTANEPPEVLEPVVIGARAVRGARRILILDDGARPWVREMARRLGVEYHSRATRAGAKAGNLNYGLCFTDAEFVMTLDADHVPMPEFLERTAGFFDDPRVGFVQTPQSFYNAESMTFRRRRRGGRVWHEQAMFYGCVQPAKNRSNSAFFTGTGAVLRRAALDSVDGFAVGTATEDIHTSIRLHAHGWRSVYLPTPLAYGLEVDNLREYYRTRRRWAAGSLGLLFRSADSPLRIRGLTTRQRLNYLSATLAHLQGGQRLIYLLTPILTVATLHAPIRGSLAVFSAGYAAFVGFSLWITYRYGRGHFHPVYSEMFNFAAIVPMLVGLRGLLAVERKFEVSAKRAGRRGGGVKLVYWAMAVACLLGLARAVDLLLHGVAVSLAGWSAGFLALDVAVLVGFLVAMARYERRAGPPPYARLTPAALYRYVRFRAAAPGRANSVAAWSGT